MNESSMADPHVLAGLGPLAPLAGVWEGDQGVDIAPGRDGPVKTPFRERITFEPMGPVENGPQRLYGLRYATVAWPMGEDEPFHEELGYWMWDTDAKTVMRCFMVPRVVTVNAVGQVEPDARSFTLSADVGSQTDGILSNAFLDQAFRTVRYELKVTIHDNGSFGYEEDTQLQICGQSELFHHTDQNILTRIP